MLVEAILKYYLLYCYLCTVMGWEEGVTLFIAVIAEILLQLGWFSFLEHKATCAS